MGLLTSGGMPKSRFGPPGPSISWQIPTKKCHQQSSGSLFPHCPINSSHDWSPSWMILRASSGPVQNSMGTTWPRVSHSAPLSSAMSTKAQRLRSCRQRRVASLRRDILKLAWTHLGIHVPTSDRPDAVAPARDVRYRPVVLCPFHLFPPVCACAEGAAGMGVEVA